MKIVAMAIQTQIVVSSFRSSALTAYKKSYEKRGDCDFHKQVFESLITNLIEVPSKVLYPGCHRHITPSLVFPNVDYVDCDKRVENVFIDSVVRDWVMSEYKGPEAPEWTFTCASFEEKLLPTSRFVLGGYDLLISLSAGLVSSPCQCYVKPGGHLLVTDSHADASAAFVNDEFELQAVWEGGQWEKAELDEYFRTTKGDPISKQQAEEAYLQGSISKRSFRFLKTAPFYLFQKRLVPSVDIGRTHQSEPSKKKKRRKIERKS